MPTSGSVDFNLSGARLVKSAMRLIGVIHSGEEPSPEEMQDSLEALELLIKTLQKGKHLWTTSEATLFVTKNTAAYLITGSRALSTFRKTSLSVAGSDTDTTVTLNSVTGVTDGDEIGILNGDEYHWATVSGAPAGFVVTLSDALTADILIDATVIVYTAATDLINRPLRVSSMRRSHLDIDTPMNEIAREDYFNLPNKTVSGVPTQFYYDPSLSVGTTYIWPTPASEADTMRFTYHRPIEDFDIKTNNADLPSEWLETLKYQLAVRLAPEYGVKLKPEVGNLAGGLLSEAEDWDNETESLCFQPDVGEY